jgi:hypothetical protein
MKTIIALISTLIFSLILGFDWQSENWVLNFTNELAQSEEVIPLAIVQEMINRVDQDRILTDLRRLTGKEQICTTNNGCTKISGRYTQSDGLRWA